MAGGLDPRECDLTEHATEVQISHIPSGSHFVIGGGAGHYSGTYVVGTSAIAWPFDAHSWARLPEKGGRWAAEVKRDVDTPDLWAKLRRNTEFVTGVRFESLENTTFTPDEQAEIATRLRDQVLRPADVVAFERAGVVLCSTVWSSTAPSSLSATWAF